MSDEYSEYMADGEDNHPALKRFNRPLSMLKHVAGKALKWAAIGAIVGAVVIGLLPAVLGVGTSGAAALLSYVPLIGKGMATGVMESAASGIMAVALKGLTFGAIAGAALGGLKGVTGAGEAADTQAEMMVANAENREARQLNREMMAMQREQQLMALRQAQMDLMERGGAGPLPAGAPYKGQDGMGRG